MSTMVCANWKQYLSVEESILLYSELSDIVSDTYELVIAPSHTSLYPCAHIETRHALAAQDCFYENRGAFTGTVAPEDIRSLGCTYVILGHSERRMYQQETNELIAKKVSVALASGLIPIICVGETQQERDEQHAQEVINQQVGVALENVDNKADCIIAYEPRWAITGSGSGVAITPQDASDMHDHIKSLTDNTCRVLYGGSVNPQNITSFTSLANCDGVLVGSASTKLATFKELLK